MRFAFIKEHRRRWPVVLMCRVLRVSRNGFYDYVGRPRNHGKRARRCEELTPKIEKIHAENRQVYGSPRITEVLQEEGERVSKNTAAKIMKEHGIIGKNPAKRRPTTTQRDASQPVAQNVLDRDTHTTAANQKWVADITYLETSEGWVYLAAVLDLFSRRIVGWALADHMKADLVCEALTMALLQERPGSDLIHHSDRGSQYTSGGFQKLLAMHGITASMSRKGNCWDNAVMESFWGTLKRELGDYWQDKASVRPDLFDYIEVFYNRQRLHSALGYKSPTAYLREHQAV
jgi:putative transposase